MPRPLTKTPNSQLADEIFTDRYLLNLMCDRSEPLISDITKKVFEPGCGTGNFLVEILRRRLLKTADSPHLTLVALSNLYGVDVNRDYLDTTYQRLHSMIADHYSATQLDYRFWPLAELFLEHNLIVADLTQDLDHIQIVEWQVFAPYQFSSHPQPLSSLKGLHAAD